MFPFFGHVVSHTFILTNDCHVSRRWAAIARQTVVDGVKGPFGSAGVATQQARYDGAIGSRAMHSLQNYGVEEAEYDGKGPYIHIRRHITMAKFNFLPENLCRGCCRAEEHSGLR